VCYAREADSCDWLALLFSGCASSSTGGSNVDAAKVRVVNDAKLVSTCQVLGTVADNEFEDLQKKAARLGGDVALTFDPCVAPCGGNPVD